MTYIYNKNQPHGFFSLMYKIHYVIHVSKQSISLDLAFEQTYSLTGRNCVTASSKHFS